MGKFMSRLTIFAVVAVFVLVFCGCCYNEMTRPVVPTVTQIVVEYKVIEGVVSKVWTVTDAYGRETHFARLINGEQDYRVNKDVMEFIEAHGLDKSYRFTEYEKMVVVKIELVGE